MATSGFEIAITNFENEINRQHVAQALLTAATELMKTVPDGTQTFSAAKAAQQGAADPVPGTELVFEGKFRPGKIDPTGKAKGGKVGILSVELRPGP